jgi:nitrogen fixation protein FixH
MGAAYSTETTACKAYMMTIVVYFFGVVGAWNISMAFSRADSSVVM